jgi:curli production assembly/transport component CsgE
MMHIYMKILFLFFLMISFCQIYSQKDQDTLKQLPEELKTVLKKYQKEASLDKEIREEEDISLLLDGLIINETVSKMGNDFYQYFHDNWDIPASAKKFTIYINEKPMPGMGNLITIKINHDEIFKNRISPRQEVIKSLAGYAISQAQRYLMNYEKIKEQLEGDDMSGTGIY